MTDIAKNIWRDLAEVRKQQPLVHNITNLVVMNWTANVLLAIGAAPIMAHAEEEVEEIATTADALVLNIGTLDVQWTASMETAARVATAPIVFDPVGNGFTRLRSETTKTLLGTNKISVLRGNAAEIAALVGCSRKQKGVDGTAPYDDASAAAMAAARIVPVVCASGAIDAICTIDRAWGIANGHPLMSRVTGMGCAATALIGAFLAVSSSALEACLHAMAVGGIAGELAAEKSTGPGSFQHLFLDYLAALDEEVIAQRLRIEERQPA